MSPNGPGRRVPEPASCFDCAGLPHCQTTSRPGLTREQARHICAHCQSLHRGRNVEIVRVRGRTRGMSRKNAEALVLRGTAIWDAPGCIKLLDRN